MVTELTALRRTHSKTFDLGNGNRRLVACAGVPLHNVDGSEVDYSLERVQTIALDGWRVMSNDIHYALGRPGDKATDGWMGYGGRKGEHWLKWRLLRVGYLHWPTRNWQDIGGAPTYDRSNLSRQTQAIDIEGQRIAVGTLAEWRDIWPGISVRWHIDGNGVNEKVIISQERREWIRANRPPSTPLGETFFGFVYELDVSDVPRWIRDGQDMNINADNDDGLEGKFELRNEAQELLGVIPIRQVYVPGAEPGSSAEYLRKRIWYDGNNHYLLVGVRCDRLADLAAGDLVFDPTIEEQVGTGADDGRWQHEDGKSDYYNAGESTISFMRTATGYECVNFWARFTGIQFTSTPTIDTATLEVRCSQTSSTDPGDATVSAIDSDDPTAPTSATDADGRARTTANVTWDIGGWSSGTWYSPPDLSAVIQEIVDSYDYVSSAKAICIYCETIGEGTSSRQIYGYENAAADAAKLTIEYTEAGGQDIFLSTLASALSDTPSAPIYVSRRVSSTPVSVSSTPSSPLSIRRGVAATAVGVSSSPDTVPLLVERVVGSIISTSSSTSTPGLAIERALASLSAGISSTPSAILALERYLTSSPAAVSITPDDVALLMKGLLYLQSLVDVRSETSSAPLYVTRPITASPSAISLTPDAGLSRLLLLARTITIASSTAAPRLPVYRFLSGSPSVATATGDVVAAITRYLASATTGATNTPQVPLVVQRLLSAAASSLTITPDDVTLTIPGEVPLSALVSTKTLTPDDVELLLVVIGAMHVAFSGRAPVVSMSGRRPNITVSGRRPEITFS